jgi:hypothetical protein
LPPKHQISKFHQKILKADLEYFGVLEFWWQEILIVGIEMTAVNQENVTSTSVAVLFISLK